jgi:uncharacterized cupredoxin-like copper-binding protein
MAARPLALTVSILVALSVACAKSEPPKAESAAPAPPAGPNVVEVVASDSAFMMPDTLPAGPTTFHLVNQGPSIHHIQVVRLDSGKTMADFAKVNMEKGPPSWIVMLGGPNSPVPGGSSDGSLDLAAGNYVVICGIPGPDGIPHAVKGMVHPLTVVPSDVQRAMPEADITVTLSDYSFTFSKPLTAGKHLVRVDNGAAQPHEIFIAKLAPGKTTEDLVKWAEKQAGPPPAMPLGGTTMIHPGGSNTIAIELTPGEYGLWCFFPDVKDGKPHFAHGMMQQITVQ